MNKIVFCLSCLLLCVCCRNFNKQEESVNYEIANKSAIYSGLDMTKKFSETLEYIKENKSLDYSETSYSYIDDEITNIINIHEADTTIRFEGEFALKKTDSLYIKHETYCKAHFLDSVFYFLEMEIYFGSVDEKEDNEIDLLYKMYKDKYGAPIFKDNSSVYRMDQLFSGHSYVTDYYYLHARLRTHYDIIGWEFPDLYIYIGKSWDDEKRWFVDRDDLRYAAEDVTGSYFTDSYEYNEFEKILNRVYVKKTEESSESSSITVFYVNKSIQDRFDKLERQKEMQEKQKLERYKDSLSDAQKKTNELNKEIYQSQNF